MKPQLAGWVTQVSGSEATSPSPPPGSTGRPSAIPRGSPVIWFKAMPRPVVSQAQPGAAAKAIISEISTCARRLVEHGETSSIDLRFLKSMPDERELLASLLGHGEVSAVVESIGRSEVRETAIPCVWWIRHYNSADETVGELIEIADIPELLIGDRDAIAFALEALAGIEAPRTSPYPQER